jgi:hypothetical protein
MRDAAFSIDIHIEAGPGGCHIQLGVFGISYSTARKGCTIGFKCQPAFRLYASPSGHLTRLVIPLNGLIT